MLPTWRAAIINNLVDKALTFLASVDVLASVHSLDGNEVLSALFVFVLVSEANLSKRCTSASVVNDVPHNTLDVTRERIKNCLGAFARRAIADAEKALTPLSQRNRWF